MPLYRFTVRWSGFVGAPGYTNLHFLNPEEPTLAIRDTTVSRVRTFFEAIKGELPNVVTLTYPTEFEELDTATGELLQTLDITPVAVTAGSAAGDYSAPSGACINWSTSQVVNGRRLRGRTFIVPMIATAYDLDGSLDNTRRTAMQTAANTLCSFQDNLVLAVWHRPTGGGSDGVAAQVSSASITDKAAILTSRRD